MILHRCFISLFLLADSPPSSHAPPPTVRHRRESSSPTQTQAVPPLLRLRARDDFVVIEAIQRVHLTADARTSSVIAPIKCVLTYFLHLLVLFRPFPTLPTLLLFRALLLLTSRRTSTPPPQKIARTQSHIPCARYTSIGMRSSFAGSMFDSPESSPISAATHASTFASALAPGASDRGGIRRSHTPAHSPYSHLHRAPAHTDASPR
ncbi:hypothetical protein C8R45DRAFT_515827 [Mycena sanguinolenta]|nr:hypothetical protein C8R45DRAFT_515827 [Mycena sanguinolenta]